MGQVGRSALLAPPVPPPPLLPLPLGTPGQDSTPAPRPSRPAAWGSEPPPGTGSPGRHSPRVRAGEQAEGQQQRGGHGPRPGAGRRWLPSAGLASPPLRRLRGRGLRLDTGRTGAGSGGRPRPRRPAGLRAAPRDPAPLRRAAPLLLLLLRPRSRRSGWRGPGSGGHGRPLAPGPRSRRLRAAQPTLLPAARPPVPRAVGSARRVAAARSEAVPAAGRSFPNYTPGNALGRGKGGRERRGGDSGFEAGNGVGSAGAGRLWGTPQGAWGWAPGRGPRRPEGAPDPAVVSARGGGSLGFPDLLWPYWVRLALGRPWPGSDRVCWQQAFHAQVQGGDA